MFDVLSIVIGWRRRLRITHRRWLDVRVFVRSSGHSDRRFHVRLLGVLLCHSLIQRVRAR